MPTDADVEVLSRETNGWVVKTAGRQFPGIVIQGDSLSVLCHLAEELQTAAEPKSDAWFAANSLVTKLTGYQNLYEKALSAQGIPLPYSKSS